jgi:hypothetical protein
MKAGSPESITSSISRYKNAARKFKRMYETLKQNSASKATADALRSRLSVYEKLGSVQEVKKLINIVETYMKFGTPEKIKRMVLNEERRKSFAKDVKERILWEKADKISAKTKNNRVKVKRIIESNGFIGAEKALNKRIVENYSPKKRLPAPAPVKVEVKHPQNRALAFFENVK